MKHKDYSSTYMSRSTELEDHISVKGFDFEKFKGEDFDKAAFFDSFLSTGFQATELGKAIEICKEMVASDSKIYVSMTGNVISSGLRDVIVYLVKHGFVAGIVTTAAGVEEDVIKSLGDFKIGSFSASGRGLFEAGVGRIGNIFVPNSRYLDFERFMTDFFSKFEDKKVLSPSFITYELGKMLPKSSFLHWASKLGVPVFCPGIIDGSLGDIAYFQNQRSKFAIDVVSDHKKIIDEALLVKSAGAILLGGGISKHYLLNSQIFRDGLDYAVYINVAEEAFGSDSGGNEEEAKSWAKIRIDGSHVKVKCDFTIAFPLIVAAAFS